MRILVTGAAGFMGRNLVDSLAANGDATSLVACHRSADGLPAWCAERGVQDCRRCDLADPQAVSAAFVADEHFDVVIHLAANGDPTRSVRQPACDLRSGPLALVTLFERITCRRLLYFSSGAVYEGAHGVVSPETPLAPRLPYAVSKLAAEAYARSICERIGRAEDYVIVRFFGAFGPHEPQRKLHTRLVRAFAIDRSAHFTIRGDGRNLIDAMYVRDAVDAVHTLIRHPGLRRATLDLAAGDPLTIDQLVRRAAHCFGIDGLHIEHAGETAEYNRFHADAARTRALLPWSPVVSLEDGLQRLAEHLQHARAA